ncbi:Succinate dehydrogenase subunit 7B, mitochondrial, partial [Linum perenne]
EGLNKQKLRNFRSGELRSNFCSLESSLSSATGDFPISDEVSDLKLNGRYGVLPAELLAFFSPPIPYSGRTFDFPSWIPRRDGTERESRNNVDDICIMQLLAEDPAINRFKSYKKSVSKINKIGDFLTVVVVAGCCYEIYVKATMREESRKQAGGSA